MEPDCEVPCSRQGMSTSEAVTEAASLLKRLRQVPAGCGGSCRQHGEACTLRLWTGSRRLLTVE